MSNPVIICPMCDCQEMLGGCFSCRGAQLKAGKSPYGPRHVADEPFDIDVQPTSIRYQKKPIQVEAIQWVGNTMNDKVPLWFIEAFHKDSNEPGSIRIKGDNAHITMLSSIEVVNPGDWILRGTLGEIYPCKSGVFELSYEKKKEIE